MGMARSSKPVKGQMTARGHDYLTSLEGPVMLAYGANRLRITGFLSNLRGNFGAKPRYRKFALRPDAPQDAAFTEGDSITTESQFSQDFSLTDLGAFMWIQPLLGSAVTKWSCWGRGFRLFSGLDRRKCTDCGTADISSRAYGQYDKECIFSHWPTFPGTWLDWSDDCCCRSQRGILPYHQLCR